MSGGSFDYMYYRIQEMYGNRLEDKELNELLDDFCEILRELEWLISMLLKNMKRLIQDMSF